MRLQSLDVLTKSLLSPKATFISALYPLPRKHPQVLAWPSPNAVAAPKDSRRSFSYTTSWKEEIAEPSKVPKRKPRKKRGPTVKASLGRIALEAELSQRRNVNSENRSELSEASKVVTAYCVAQEYDMNQVHSILQKRGMQVGPSGTLLYPEEPEVIHIEMPLAEDTVPYFTNSATTESGDVFIFPSGTIVSWGVPRSHIDFLRSEVLAPAAQKPLGEDAEDENLEYSEDPNEDRSLVIAEKIVLGTRLPTAQDTPESNLSNLSDGTHRPLRIVLAKIAFSSGLARATKLAVLENLVDEYSQSSRSILSILMNGSMRLKSRKWVYEKIGQLLDLRAQLNLYSELADDLPDLFWDTKHELGLESYYDQISKALDTQVRIKTLNQKMDYAEEIISNLRDMRSEIHSSRLEWIIIGLITFEVLYAIWTEAFRIPARYTANTEAESKPA